MKTRKKFGLRLGLASNFQLECWVLGVGITFAARECASKLNVARVERGVYSFFGVKKSVLWASRARISPDPVDLENLLHKFCQLCLGQGTHLGGLRISAFESN